MWIRKLMTVSRIVFHLQTLKKAIRNSTDPSMTERCIYHDSYFLSCSTMQPQGNYCVLSPNSLTGSFSILALELIHPYKLWKFHPGLYNRHLSSFASATGFFCNLWWELNGACLLFKCGEAHLMPCITCKKVRVDNESVKFVVHKFHLDMLECTLQWNYPYHKP